MKSAGDIEDVYMGRKIKHGFTGKEEWWQIAMQHQTKSLKLSIIFPKKRRCQRAVLIERVGVVTWETANCRDSIHCDQDGRGRRPRV